MQTTKGWTIDDSDSAIPHMVWSGARAAIDATRLEQLVGCWLPEMLGIRQTEVIDDQLILRSDAISDGARRLIPATSRRNVAAQLARICGRGFELDQFAAVLTPCGPRVVPTPRSWLSGPAGDRTEATNEPSVGVGLRFVGRESCLDRALRPLRDAHFAAQAIVYSGEEGSGKTSLLRVAGVRAALCGANVLYDCLELPDNARPVVVILDDVDHREDEPLARIAAAIERSGRRSVVVLASARRSQEIGDLPGLAIDCVALPRLSATTLVAASVCEDIDAGALRDAALRAGGNPLRFRLSLGFQGRNSNQGRGLERRLRGLSPAARTILEILELIPDGVETSLLSRILDEAKPSSDVWTELTGLVRLQGCHLRLVSESIATWLRSLEDRDCAQLAERVLASLDDKGDETRLRARLLTRLGRHSEAYGTLTRALGATPAATLQSIQLLRRAGCEPDSSLHLREVVLLAQAGHFTSALAVRERHALEPVDEIDRGHRHLQRARQYACCGDIAGADAEIEAALELAPTDPRFEADRLLVTGWVALNKGEIDRARALFELGLTRSADLDLRYRAEALAGLGTALGRRDGRRRRGDAMLREARRLFTALGLHSRESEVLGAEGDVAWRRGDDAIAFDRSLLALEASLVDGDSLLVAQRHAEVAILLIDRAELARADKHVQQSLRRFDAGGDTRSLTVARRLQAAIALEHGQPLAAEPILLDGLVAARRLGSTTTEFAILILLGRTATLRGQVDIAWAHFADALDVAHGLDDVCAQAVARLGRSRVALDAGDANTAADEAESGLRTLAPVERSTVALRLRLALARARLLSGDHPRAVALLMVRATDMTAAHDLAIRADFRCLQAACAAAAGRPEAKALFDRALALAADAADRPDILGRALVDAVRWAHVFEQPERWTTLIAALRRIYAGAELQGRLKLLDIPEALEPAPEPDVLAQDGLAQLEAALRDKSVDVRQQQLKMLELLRRRVPCLRAAILGDGGDGLRVFAHSMLGNDLGSGPMDLARLFGERARLTKASVVVTDAREDAALRAHPEVTRRNIGPIAVVISRSNLVLYLDRSACRPAFSPDEVRFAEAMVERASLEPPVQQANESWRRLEVEEVDEPAEILGVSDAAHALRRELGNVAKYDIPVFLSGATGTGKELAARAIHRLSRRAGSALVPLNCAALAEGLLESELFGAVKGAYSGAICDRDGLLVKADKGVLFLDEVAELSPAFQAKLLRVVELGEFRPVGSNTILKVDVRFVCATNRNMVEAVERKQFREDLYYRLMSSAVVDLPPLRRRIGDVPVLTSVFLAREAERHGVAPLTLSAEALSALESYQFPGNIRELERLLAGLYARCEGRRVEVKHLPERVRGMVTADSDRNSLKRVLEICEEQYLKGVLTANGFNRTRAAQAAGVARQTLLNKLRRHKLLHLAAG